MNVNKLHHTHEDWWNWWKFLWFLQCFFRVEMSQEKEKLIFILGDKLPTYYDAAISIYQVSQSPKTHKMQITISAYFNALIDTWQKSFTAKHVLSSKASIVKKVESVVSHYYNNIYNPTHRSSQKHKGVPLEKVSIRCLGGHAVGTSTL